MDFDLSPAQQELVDLIDDVGMREFRPKAFEQRFRREVPRDNLRRLGELGVLGVCLPEAHGGSGRPYLDGLLAIERIAHACPVTGDHAVMAICGPAMFIAEWGTEDQKARYVPPVAAGRSGCWISLTEPEAGTALTDLTTQATMTAEGCRLNGFKRPAGPAEDADFYLVFVRFGPGAKGIGAVIVDRDTPGLTLSEPRRWMGDAPWCELTFADALVPAANVLFTGEAMRKLLGSYTVERCAAGAMVLGIAQIAFEQSVAYAESRTQFGRPIADFQLVQAKLADMYIRLQSARLLLHRAISADTEDGLPDRALSSAAKVATVETACFVCDEAMQIHGAMGMSVDTEPLEWLYRYVRPYAVAGGTSEIHRSMIAAELVGRRFGHRP
ncbi:acyl-CoA dehydrogenase [Baekduia soli]|uniref:Acyl-CoA dehydrogenase n=1 Tax=Baekduia soli TaxID=496014 RepID=A0A5B8U1U2_9ACTN|nr:acyl-CoA dehydrogenase family protein [Baekduia soli]QEC46966.1 acyl-CoA dehydrogenase [Baekduia soli]